MRSAIARALLALTLTLTTMTATAEAGTSSCWRFRHDRQISRCFVVRAAEHYHQSRSEALYIAWRESRYHYRVTNGASGAAGLFQFMPTTWAHSPYRRRSPYNPRWAALAAMWFWAHGGKFHWAA